MMKIPRATTIAFATVAIVSLAQPAFGQTDRQKKLGTVHFETSCKPEAQKLFNRAMLYQHSFWYRASQKVFEDVLKADPECGIAYWGIALSLLWNPHVAAAGEESRRWRRHDRQGQERRRQDPARARLSRRARRHVRRLRQGRPPHPHRGLLPRPWSNWRSAIRTTTKRRSTTRSRSTPRLRRPTRPTPTSSRARQSSSRSASASRNIPAWRIT